MALTLTLTDEQLNDLILHLTRYGRKLQEENKELRDRIELYRKEIKTLNKKTKNGITKDNT